MQKKQQLKFPKSFLWGAATSAHQVEGGNHNDWSAWEENSARAKAAQGSYVYDELPTYEKISSAVSKPDNYISAKASDHYNKYKDDFKLLKKMNMNAFRFSIEWSRIEPKEGAWNAAAIEHYKNYLTELKKQGIEPVVTLWHFTLPQWFADKGGFEKRSNIQYFERFVEKIMAEYGKKMRYVITINEPAVYATEAYLQGHWPPQKQSKITAYRVLNNLAKAHKKAHKIIKQSNPRVRVGLAYNSAYFYPGDDAWLSQVSAFIMQYFHDDYFLGQVKKKCDFIGLNYYFSNRVYGYRIHNPNKEQSDLGWDLSPENIEYALERVHNKYNLPIMVTENGLADMHDAHRKEWILKTITAMNRAIKEHDVDIIGYMHWSLIDNFEWAHGLWPRFGLVEIDYASQERSLRPSAVWFGKVIAKIRKESGVK